MSAARARSWLLLLAAMLALAGPAGAHEIYKWVDENGVVHYGDARPAGTDAPVQTLHIPETNPPGYDPVAESRAVVAEAERIRESLAAERAAREEAADRQRALEAEARIAELERRVAEAEAAAYSARGIYAPFGRLHRRVFPPFLHRMPHRPHHRPPPRPPADDGPRPGWPGPGAAAAPASPSLAAPAA